MDRRGLQNVDLLGPVNSESKGPTKQGSRSSGCKTWIRIQGDTKCGSGSATLNWESYTLSSSYCIIHIEPQNLIRSPIKPVQYKESRKKNFLCGMATKRGRGGVRALPQRKNNFFKALFKLF